MKKLILIIAVCTCMTGAFLTSCNNAAEKVEKAQKNSIDAAKELEKANEEYLADIESYRKNTAEKIDSNQKIIDGFNERISQVKEEARDEYRKTIAELEQRNRDMQQKIDDYKSEGKEKWKTFKTEFGRDMDELGKAFNDLTIKNIK